MVILVRKTRIWLGWLGRAVFGDFLIRKRKGKKCQPE